MAYSDAYPLQTRFWLEFRIDDDGLDSGRAQQMASRRAAALGDGDDVRNYGFGCFQALPPELRLKIWDYLIAPRIVKIFCLQELTFTGGNGPFLTGGIPMTPPEPSMAIDIHDRPWASQTPLILHVNREARAHALKRYELAFSWKVPHVLAGMDMASTTTTTTTRTGETSSSSLSSRPPPSWSEPRLYFNFALDTIYLAGELEPYDSFGFNSPMTYFLRKEDCLRVRHIALAFGALHYGEAGSQQIFGALFHVVDRFNPPLGKVLVTVTPRDEETHAMLGGEESLVPTCSSSLSSSNRSVSESDAKSVSESTHPASAAKHNIVQKLWDDWYRGSVVKSRLANMRFVLIHDWDLASHIEQSDSALSATLSRSNGGKENSLVPGDDAMNAHSYSLETVPRTNFYDEEEDYASIPPGMEALAL
ncbi:hypothetical protein Micbo1qcDRAFT_229676 [Microdochium bolleyi]|uniref:2EXR domain-containing protein n=1 Tax=Microdochium bolleyi TaxID=196109 RepID=A0A136JIA4_9PEZI|nr:hypothetical protein Micbo1qcDRAFT_229676 [Microdochium bolleyi]